MPNRTATGVRPTGRLRRRRQRRLHDARSRSRTTTCRSCTSRAQITGGASVPVLLASKNGRCHEGCSVQASPLAVDCSFRATRRGDVSSSSSPSPRPRRSERAATPGWTYDRRRDRPATTATATCGARACSRQRAAQPRPLGGLRQPDPDDQAGLRQQQAVREAVEPAGRQVRQGQRQRRPERRLPDHRPERQQRRARRPSSSWSPIPRGPKQPAYFDTRPPASRRSSTTLCNNAPKVNCFDLEQADHSATLYLAHNGSPPPQRLAHRASWPTQAVVSSPISSWTITIADRSPFNS